MRIRLLVAAVAAAALTACATTGSGTIPAAHDAASTLNGSGLTPLSTFTARDDATGTLVHVLPTRDALKAARGNGRAVMGINDLTYHGGPVQTAPKIYVVFWGSSWSTSAGDPYGVAARLKGFYGVIGGSGWLNTVTQYYQSNGLHVGNASGSFVGSYIDTSSSPPSSPTQSQLAVEANRTAAHYGDYSINAGYVVALPHGVRPAGFGSQYCATRSTTATSGGTMSYTILPYMPDAGASCGANSVNSILDGVTIIAGAEQADVETDPQPNSGWLNSSGQEIGDICTWTSPIDNPAAGGYATRPLWSNATSSCVQSYP